jgi:hypothetical protein
LTAAAGSRHDGELLDRQSDEQAALSRAQAGRLPARGLAGGSSAAPQPGLPAADAKALQAALDMLSIRNHPWADVFAGVESAGRHVAMLELQHDSSQAVINIDVAVPSDDAAWAFAESLAADTGRFSQATLLTRERMNPVQGAMSARARVQAVLKAVKQPIEGRAP